MHSIHTLSHEETKRLSLWFENRRLVMPSDGGFDNSRPVAAGTADAMSGIG